MPKDTIERPTHNNPFIPKTRTCTYLISLNTQADFTLDLNLTPNKVKGFLTVDKELAMSIPLIGRLMTQTRSHKVYYGRNGTLLGSKRKPHIIRIKAKQIAIDTFNKLFKRYSPDNLYYNFRNDWQTLYTSKHLTVYTLFDLCLLLNKMEEE